MTPEEMQRKIEFIIEHHAQFAVDIERLKERQEKTTKDIDALVSLMARLEKAQERTDGQVAELAEIRGEIHCRPRRRPDTFVNRLTSCGVNSNCPLPAATSEHRERIFSCQPQ